MTEIINPTGGSYEYDGTLLVALHPPVNLGPLPRSLHPSRLLDVASSKIMIQGFLMTARAMARR